MESPDNYSTKLQQKIISILKEYQTNVESHQKLLRYAVEIFEINDLGTDYYGYHNIEHELEGTYITLLAAKNFSQKLTQTDINCLFTAALFHDFDPQKNVDRPHEKFVMEFVKRDTQILELFDELNVDMNIVLALILRTTYPWEEKLQRELENYLEKSSAVKDDSVKKKHYSDLGWLLSVSERMSGYALGNFERAIDLAKKNAFGLTWMPSTIIPRSVDYFNDISQNETEMYEIVINSLPEELKLQYLSNVDAFLNLKEKEIQIHDSIKNENVALVPVLENIPVTDDNTIEIISELYKEIPKPLQFNRDIFLESLEDPETILITLRVGNESGQVVGFVKAGPLENFRVPPKISDVNFGKSNTVFLEGMSLHSGYWGHDGGSKLRTMLLDESKKKGYKFQAGFSPRGVIQRRLDSGERVQFVHKFDPERWDYYRLTL